MDIIWKQGNMKGKQMQILKESSMGSINLYVGRRDLGFAFSVLNFVALSIDLLIFLKFVFKFLMFQTVHFNF